jgi:hypothetical protein
MNLLPIIIVLAVLAIAIGAYWTYVLWCEGRDGE